MPENTLKSLIRDTSYWFYENNEKWFLHLDKYTEFVCDLMINHNAYNSIDNFTLDLLNAGKFITALINLTSNTFMNFEHYANTITNLENFYSRVVYLTDGKIYFAKSFSTHECIGNYKLVYKTDGKILLRLDFNS